MDPLVRIVLAIIITLIILVGILYAYCYFIGWTPFSYQRGQTVSFGSIDAKISHLRFKNVIFTVTVPGSQPVSKDVTSTLNNMAYAWVGANPPTSPSAPNILSLDLPLNPFSFVIKGFNDPATVSTPNTSQWQTATVSLNGTYKFI